MNRLLVLLLLLTACNSDDDAASSAGTGGTSGTSGGSGGASGSGGEATGKGGTGATSAGTSGTTGHGGSMAAGAGKGGTGNGKGGAGGTSGTSGDAGAGADGGTSGTSGEPGAGTGPTGDARYFGDAHSGNFWLGPVDYAETEWHNACAPSVKYPPAIQSLYGDYIMGLANEVVLEGLKASDGQLCDTCVELTANGQTFVARAITFGQETGPNDIDVSPELDTALDGAASRSVTWRFTTCSTSEPVTYTFDGAQWDNVYFFRVWVRNARIPITKVEYRLGTGSWATADEQGDGAWQASNDDFSGGFSLRVTAIDGQTLEDDLPGLNTFDPNVGVASHANFQ